MPTAEPQVRYRRSRSSTTSILSLSLLIAVVALVFGVDGIMFLSIWVVSFGSLSYLAIRSWHQSSSAGRALQNLNLALFSAQKQAGAHPEINGLIVALRDVLGQDSLDVPDQEFGSGSGYRR
jgi:hypothetical protein